MRQFLKEPFVHFVAIGAILFAGHTLWTQHITRTANTIVIDPAEMERQAAIFATEQRRQPTDADLEALLFAHVEEQVLVREAERLGLNTDDTIIRRRLAQKMRFMINDVGAPPTPSAGKLRAWFNANTDKFQRPVTRSFEHIYLSPKGRADTVSTDASQLLANGIPEDWESLGDAFMSGRAFSEESKADVKRDFGTDFSNALFDLNLNEWSGPISSAFGVHLVRVTQEVPQSLPTFEDIQIEVKSAWREQAQEQSNIDRLRQLIEKYKIEVAE